MYQIQSYSHWNRTWNTLMVTLSSRNAFELVAIRSREHPMRPYRVTANKRTICEYYGGEEISYNMLVA